MPNQRVCDFADPPTEEEGGGLPKKVAQCKRYSFGGRRTGPMLQYGREPFVLLSDPITFGSLAGGKEIDVLINH